MVAAQVRSGPKSVATLGFAAEFLMLSLPDHLPLADQAAVPIKGGVAAAAAEGLALTADGNRELAAVFRVAAAVE